VKKQHFPHILHVTILNDKYIKLKKIAYKNGPCVSQKFFSPSIDALALHRHVCENRSLDRHIVWVNKAIYMQIWKFVDFSDDGINADDSNINDSQHCVAIE
jgi:hypothetical protein